MSLPTPPNPGLPASGWFGDPTGRHSHRYWDGTAWTTNVSDNGLTSQDTVTAGPAALLGSPPTTHPGPGILTLVAGGMALLGAMLPWVSVTTIFGSLSKNGMDGDGQLTALGGLVLGVIALIVLVTKTRNRAPAVLAIVVGAAIFVVGLIDLLDVSHRIAGLQATAGADASVGIGLWLTCLAGLVGVAGGIALVAPKLLTP
jgi:hypothetical protein